MARHALLVMPFLALTLTAGQAAAGLMVDQSYTAPPGNLGAVLAEGVAFVGQTATTGITGNLVAVELNAYRRPNFLIPWVLDIQQVVAGVPTGVVFSSTVISPADFYSGTLYGNPSVPLPLQVDLATPVFFQAGDPFAIVLHPQGVTGRPGLLAGLWAGNPTDGYAGGSAVFGPQANNLQVQDFDLHFRTIVDTGASAAAPEPTGITLLVVGGLGLFSYRRWWKRG